MSFYNGKIEPLPTPTKTLTEQSCEGTLPEGWYYLKVKSELENYPVISECVINYSSLKPYSYFYEYDDSRVEEVLSPVPSYDHFSQLVKKVEQLQERLADADKALKAMDEKYGEHYTIADGTKMGNSPAWKYMLKWGVK